MDILSRLAISTTATTSTRTAKRYLVCVGSCATMHSRRLYTYAQARRVASRAKRFGLDAYVSSPMTVREVVTLGNG